MRYEIRHHLQYRYDGPVALEPLRLRLRPRCGPGQELESFEWKIKPEPAGFSESWDPFGNAQALAWFTGADHEGLSVLARSVVRSDSTNPFNYLVTDPGLLKIPAAYGVEDDRSALGPYLHRDRPDPGVTDWAERILEEAWGLTLQALAHGTEQVRLHFNSVIRLEGAAWSPGETFRKGEGACRDLAVLFIDVCRAWGLAARFVSGYRYDPEAADRHEMHAWVEVYLSGAGWRGYDPSTGFVTGDRHLAVATGPDSDSVDAVRGTFRGTGVKARMDYRVDLSNLGKGPEE